MTKQPNDKKSENPIYSNDSLAVITHPGWKLFSQRVTGLTSKESLLEHHVDKILEEMSFEIRNYKRESDSSIAELKHLNIVSLFLEAYELLKENETLSLIAKSEQPTLIVLPPGEDIVYRKRMFNYCKPCLEGQARFVSNVDDYKKNFLGTKIQLPLVDNSTDILNQLLGTPINSIYLSGTALNLGMVGTEDDLKEVLAKRGLNIPIYTDVTRSVTSKDFKNMIFEINGRGKRDFAKGLAQRAKAILGRRASEKAIVNHVGETYDELQIQINYLREFRNDLTVLKDLKGVSSEKQLSGFETQQTLISVLNDIKRLTAYEHTNPIVYDRENSK